MIKYQFEKFKKEKSPKVPHPLPCQIYAFNMDAAEDKIKLPNGVKNKAHKHERNKKRAKKYGY